MMLKSSCTKRNKSMTVSDAKIEAEGLEVFFKSADRAMVNFGKKCYWSSKSFRDSK